MINYQKRLQNFKHRNQPEPHMVTPRQRFKRRHQTPSPPATSTQDSQTIPIDSPTNIKKPKKHKHNPE